jgi:hypothetical protein
MWFSDFLCGCFPIVSFLCKLYSMIIALQIPTVYLKGTAQNRVRAVMSGVVSIEMDRRSALVAVVIHLRGSDSIGNREKKKK